MISSTDEVKKLIATLQLDDYDEEILHTNIIDFFSSRGYKIDSQTKLESSSSDVNVESSLQNFKNWCEKLGSEAITKDEIHILNEKNVVMYLNKINEISFYLENNFGLPSITIILSDMADNDAMEIEMKNEEAVNEIEIKSDETMNEIEIKSDDNEDKVNIVDLDNYNKNHTLSYHPKYLHNITDKIKSLYTEHSDAVIHENKKNLNTKIIKNKLKGVELAIFNNNDIKLIVKKDKKEYVKFSEYQLEKIDDTNNLSELYSWFLEIKMVLDVKSNIISGGKKPPKNGTVQKGSHNLRERKKTNYNEIYHSDDDAFM
ncbi:hypothetical protein PIROE2DRAFT_59646 [Piromyces sp. E2]|nr:hypothetical protein PIROE2DRAFT_59646 [Piromyces sp. E2]|eukprot:OUM65996.1 hypothetical protein PIROE2DRAFT_59646 [Piromyces sp. E2]